MRCGHLFNGIGGFALAASWMGWENVMHCEIDPFCNRVMKHHFPNSFQHEDIRTTDFSIWRGRIDLITGGFPCQPYSSAGKRKGTADDRHLWPSMFRAIREISPRWIVAENVRGLTNWNGGMVFDQVQADMEAAGYEVIPFLLPAAGVGAPHRRDRIWFIAYAADNTRNDEPGNEGQKSYTVSEERFDEFIASANTASSGHEGREAFDKRQQHDGGRDTWRVTPSSGGAWVTANPDSDKRFKGGLYETGPIEAERYAGACDTWDFRNAWENFPTQPPVRSGNDGIPGGLVDITVSKWVEACITSLGNAIVPQVAYEIFKAIEQYELCATSNNI